MAGLFTDEYQDGKQANAAKSEFLSHMSHDIRTPMSVIAEMTEIADTHLEDAERVKDCLQKIRLSNHHFFGLFNDVLDMSKIENGNFPIHPASSSLPGEIREGIMITLAGVRERGRITFAIEQLPSKNPLKPELRFTVSDTGVGMKPGFGDYIFEAFTRENDSRIDRIECSGPGMAITKRLAELQKGPIAVKSQQDVGSVFQVILPMQAVSSAEEEQCREGCHYGFKAA